MNFDDSRSTQIQNTFNTVAPAYGRGATVLDVAFGTGATALPLAKNLPQGRVTAVDFSSGMLAQAEASAKESGLSNLSYRIHDMTQLPFEPHGFDHATCPFGLDMSGTRHNNEHIDGTIDLLNSAPVTYLSTLQLYLDDSILEEFHRRLGEPFEMPDDLAILKEQERLIGGLNPPQPVIFRSNHASNALALAGNLPKDKEKLLLQLHEAMSGHRPLRPVYMRGL